MNTNIGGVDRAIRIVIGLVLIGLTLSGTIGVWGWIGIVPIITAFVGFCPAYGVFKINTRPRKDK